MTRQTLSRRLFLTRSAALGCSLAASPLMTPVTMASAPGENRLVVLILRGGLDGLDAVRPYGAPEFDSYRGRLLDTAVPGELDLDGFYALHPALAPLMPLWQAGELGFAHAVSTPYRDKRSHFDGQDILEAGTASLDRAPDRDGWLNRLLQGFPGAEAETAYAIGRSDMLLTRGKADVSNWSPDAALPLSPQAEKLLDMVMHDDPLFRDATAEAIALSQISLGLSADAVEGEDALDSSGMMGAMQDSMAGAGKKGGLDEIARFAAGRLREETRIAAWSVNGFDTHAAQSKRLPRALTDLSDTLLALREALGPVWEKTAVVAMTEFGRTARANGTGGTDHGTGGAMLFAGGALRGGRVVGDWPGLAEADLYDRRDLMPTRDVRAHAGWMMRQLFGLDTGLIERSVFPGVELGADPKLIL